MRRKVLITPSAEADLDSILHFIALDNPTAGRRFVGELRRRIATLTTMPERCPLAPETGMDGLELRHLIHGRYRIIFTVELKRVVVLQVRHGARMAAGG